MRTIFLHSKLTMHWGFIVRQLGASAAQLAYILPPPPTITGSFMNPLARILGLGESLEPRLSPAGSPIMDCALKATLSASSGLEGPSGVVIHGEPSRISAALYKTGGDYSRALRQPPYLAADRLLPVQAEGAASAPGARLHLAWALDLDKLSECLGINVELKHLQAAAWSVYRIGSREGIASVVKAEVYGEDALEYIEEGRPFRTILYQPAECVEPIEPTMTVILYDKLYREARFYVPSSVGGPSALMPPSQPFPFILRSGCQGLRPAKAPDIVLSFLKGG